MSISAEARPTLGSDPTRSPNGGPDPVVEPSLHLG